MTREQVDALRQAGIPDKTIIDLIISETSAALAPEPAPAPAPADPEPEAPAPAEPAEPETPQAEPEAPAREDKILAAIERLTGAIYNQNVLFSGREDTPKESADDIIGKALRNN